jgi:hypothetical protein
MISVGAARRCERTVMIPVEADSTSVDAHDGYPGGDGM